MTVDQLKDILVAGLKEQFDFVGEVIDEDAEPVADHYVLDTSDFDVSKFAAFVLARLP